MKKFKYISAFCLLIFSLSCGKKTTTIDTDPLGDISFIPEIELLEVAPLNVVQYEDSISFKISYIDGDGDLGEQDPDIKSIFVIDNRAPNDLIFDFHLSPRAPLDSEIAIQGDLDVVLANTILVDDGLGSETTTFSIYVVDRAGNESNVLVSPDVTVNP